METSAAVWAESPASSMGGDDNDHAAAAVAVGEDLRSPSIQPNEKLLLHVKDFTLVNRLLNVRVYQVFHQPTATASAPPPSSPSVVQECVGYRVAASDDVENDYALFISRIKGDQIHRLASSSSDSDHATGGASGSAEAIANGILSNLDIIGNRHRDVGRLICKEPQAKLDKKERVVPKPKSPSSAKRRNSNDKRANRNKQSQQRVMEQIAASHDPPVETDKFLLLEADDPLQPIARPVVDHGHSFHGKHTAVVHPAVLSTSGHAVAAGGSSGSSSSNSNGGGGGGKSRKSSDTSLLKRMANANATTVWRAELEGIDDDASEYFDENEEDEEDDTGGGGDVSPTTMKMSPTATIVAFKSVPYKRAVPERKTKHKELQERRDKERNQRIHMPKAKPAPGTGTGPAAATGHASASSPPRQTSPSRHTSVSTGGAGAGAGGSPSRSRVSVTSGKATTTAYAPPAATAVIGNAYALKTFQGASQPEQEQFLRRKTIKTNDKRVFKTEGVFDDTVEITHERPVHNGRRPSATSSEGDGDDDGGEEEENLPPRPSSKDFRAVMSKKNQKQKETQSNESPRPEQIGGAEESEMMDGQVADEEASERHISEEQGQQEEPGEEASDEHEQKKIEFVGDDGNDGGVDQGESAAEEPIVVGSSDLECGAAMESLAVTGRHEGESLRSPRLLSPRNQFIEITEEDNPHDEPEELVVAPQQVDDTSQPPTGEQPYDVVLSPRVGCWEDKTGAEAPTAGALPSCGDGSETEAPPGSPMDPDKDPIEAPHEQDDHKFLGGPAEKETPPPCGSSIEPPSSQQSSETPQLVADAGLGLLEEDPVVQVLDSKRGAVMISSSNDKPHGQEDISDLPPLSQVAVHHSRKSSHADIHASAIAAAAATAAATAFTISKHSPTTEHQQHKLPKAVHKRRSHDGGTLATAAGSMVNSPPRRDRSRRSTLHISIDSGFALKSIPGGARARASPPQPTGSRRGSIKPSAAPVPALATTTTSNYNDPSSTLPHVAASLEDLASKNQSKHQNHSSNQTTHPHHGGGGPNKPHHHRTKAETEAIHNSPTYHAKWHQSGVMTGRQIIEKVSCLQLEEQLLQDPHNEKLLVKLGIRYARWHATSLAAVLLLESAASVALHHHHSASPRTGGNSAAATHTHTHEYWNSIGSAHFDVFLRHRKFLPIAQFHLARAMHAFTRAFAYMESIADPLLLLRYAICVYWKKGDANLERADDIFRQLFTKFGSFCAKDPLNLLFLHFQIVYRLGMFTEAIEYLSKIISSVRQAQLHDATADGPKSTSEPSLSTSSASIAAYDTKDYLLMLMHCQQERGDFIQASATFAQVLDDPRSTLPHHKAHELSDSDYLHLWGALADKCFHHEDYAMAIALYGITATYAKDSRVLARVVYHHALCYQAVGDEIKCNAEFKRAKNINRHVLPFATLAEIHVRYDDQYAALLHTPIATIIEEVRQTLYDRAVTALQRIFRKKKNNTTKSTQETCNQATTSQPNTANTSPPLLPKRLSSCSMLGSSERHRASSNLNLIAMAAPASETSRPVETENGNAVAENPHGAFLRRHAAAMHKLHKLRDRPLWKATSCVVAATSETQPQSGLLSPLRERPDLHRKHSMDTISRQLGYVPCGKSRYADYWHELLTTALDLYESRASLGRHLTKIRSILPLVSDEVAWCALADACGDVDVAMERLHSTSYEKELQLVSDVVDIRRILQRHAMASPPAEIPSVSPSLSPQATKFPPIKSPTGKTRSPTKTTTTMTTQQQQPPSLGSSSPLLPTVKTVRLTSLIDASIAAAASQQRHIDATTVTTTTITKDSKVSPLVVHERGDHLAVLDDFRSVNESLGWQK